MPSEALVAPPLAGAFPFVRQAPLRIGLGLVALVFYLWIIHSYKLPAGDIAVAGLGIGVLLRGGAIRIPTPLKILGVLILWASTGLAVTTSSAITMEALVGLIKLWVIAFCITNLIRTASELRFLIIAWLAIYALYPIRGALFNQYICQCTEFGRVAWNFVFENPNDLAAITLFPLGMAAGIGYVERVKIWRLAGLIGVGVLALTIMLTQSRGAMLAIGVSALLLPLSSNKKGRDLVLLILLVGVAALVAPRGVWQRLAGLTNLSVQSGMKDVDPEGSAESRWQLWQIAFSTIKQNPVTGVGAGMMPTTNRWEALRRKEGWGVRGTRDTHSTYLRLAAEMGIPGLAIFLAMWASLLVHVRRSRKKIRHLRPKEHQLLLFMELAIISFLVASIFGTYFLIQFSYLTIAVAWLAATILADEPWYVPPGSQAAGA